MDTSVIIPDKTIKVFLGKGVSASDRMFINSGVEKATGVDQCSGFKYGDNSYVPKSDWARINYPNKSFFFEGYNPSLTDTIAILKIPDYVYSQFQKINFDKVASYENVRAIVEKKKEQLQVIDKETKDYIKSMLDEGDDDIVFMGLFVGQPNLKTTTIVKDEIYGLHIDVTNATQSLTLVDTCKKRLCLNIGGVERYFLFINKPLSTLIKMIQKNLTTEYANGYDTYRLKNDFFKFYSDHPILKVKLNPGEAYLAPTDNLIHDGSTESVSSSDVVTAYLANFKNIV